MDVYNHTYTTTISFSTSIENKHDVNRGKDFMKRCCDYLREHAIKVINFKMKKNELLTKEQQEPYENVKICYICKETFKNKYLQDKSMIKLKIILIVQENIEVLCIAYVVWNIV